MSKHWRYEVWIPASESLSAGQVGHVLELAEQHGYVPRRISRILPSYDMEEYRIGSIAAAVEALYPEGDLISLGRATTEDWDTAIDIQIPSATHADLYRRAEPSGLVSTGYKRLYDELVIYVGDYIYRGEDGSHERIRHATDAQELYCDLCAYFDAPYGAGWSNYDYEEVMMDLHRAVYGHLELSFDQTLDKHTFQALMDEERLDLEVRNRRPPGVLFWLQYFSQEYAEQIDLEACTRLGGKLQLLQKGLFLTFFDYPWEVDFRTLLAVNEQWRNSNHGTLQL